ncbi:hypothetical protein HZA33_05390 [Candidatus Pacearchaeota archaeon]|nr:hypothetical protein [Candidatus Pacearchaeota archaeon]
MEKALEGILKNIEDIKYRYGNPLTGFGQKHNSQEVLIDISSTLTIQTEKGDRKIIFHGLIFPDSIGHKIEVFYADNSKNLDKGYIIVDKDLNPQRTYDSTKSCY